MECHCIDLYVLKVTLKFIWYPKIIVPNMKHKVNWRSSWQHMYERLGHITIVSFLVPWKFTISLHNILAKQILYIWELLQMVKTFLGEGDTYFTIKVCKTNRMRNNASTSVEYYQHKPINNNNSPRLAGPEIKL